MQRLNKLIRDIQTVSSSSQARVLVAKALSGEQGTAFVNNLKKAGVLAGKSRTDEYAKIARLQTSELRKMSADSWQRKHQKDMFLVAPNATYRMKPFQDIAKESSAFTQMNDAAMQIINLKSKIGDSLVGATFLPMIVTKDPRILEKELPTKIRELPQQQAKARAMAGAKYIAQLKSKYQAMVALNAQSGGLGSTSNNKVIQNNINRFKAMLSKAKYDKTLAADGIGYTSGFHLTGYLRSNTVGLDQSCPYAIEKYDDLLWFPVFRGDSFFYPNTGKRNKMYDIGDESQGMLSQQMGPTGARKKYLIRRHMINDFGEDELYDWNPAQAEDLRVRTFVSLYPFSLNNSDFKEIYDQQLNLLRTGKQTPITQTKPQAQASIKSGLSILGL